MIKLLDYEIQSILMKNTVQFKKKNCIIFFKTPCMHVYTYMFVCMYVLV